ncbi:hypothetical protein ACLOAU_00680 [Niabella sp. CJ426]|uniref:hypothetical protein n=1 Tax=Niabella sp. CJ426 TaxID=3393740 RepID=UPI003CFCAFC4
MQLNTISDLKLTVGTEANQYADVLGYYTIGDQGGGAFYWDESSTQTDNGGTIIQVTGTALGRWKRIFNDALYGKWFGAKGDGINDDTLALQSAIDEVGEKSGTLILQQGIYKTSSTLYISKENLSIEGLGNPITFSREAEITEGVTIRYTGTGTAIQVCKSRSLDPITDATNPGWMFKISIQNIRIEVSTNAKRALWVFQSVNSYFANISMWGNEGPGSELLKVSGGVNNSYFLIETNGSGRTGTSPIPTAFEDPHTEKCANLGLGWANDTATTTTFTKCYFHYGIIGLQTLYFFRFVDCVIEGNWRGLNADNDAIVSFDKCWFEANSNRDAYFGRGSFTFTDCVVNAYDDRAGYNREQIFDCAGVNRIVFDNCSIGSDHPAPYIFGSNPSGSYLFNVAATTLGAITFNNCTIDPKFNMGHIYNYDRGIIDISSDPKRVLQFKDTFIESTAKELSTLNDTGTAYIMPYDGYVTAIHYYSKFNLSAGEVLLILVKNHTGWVAGDTVSSLPFEKKWAPRLLRFSKGDHIGVTMDTSFDFAPGNTMAADIYVSFFQNSSI